jgi:nitrogen fixation NifU-like protein
VALQGDLQELYQQVILDHYQRPRNFGELEDATASVEGYNPLCGDRLQLDIKIDAGKITGVAFSGAGCAIFTASASMMTEFVKGKSPEDVESTFGAFHSLLTSETTAERTRSSLGKLAIFAGVREFPVRVKCATLPWHAIHAALSGAARSVTTE